MANYKTTNNHLKDLQRVRIPENRDLANGLRLNRNEKVDIWPEKFISNVFNEKHNNFLSIYPDLSNLYRKISEHLNVDESNILVTSGIDGAMKTIWEVATNPGDSVGVPGPTYAMYYVYSEIYKTKLTQINYLRDTFKLDWDQLYKYIDTNPTIIFLPNPNQPIDDTLSINQIEKIANITKDKDTLLVIDEAYYYFGAESAVALIDKYDHIIVMRTFSKAFGVPSIRLGYIVSNKTNMDIFAKVRLAHETNSLSATIAEYLLDNYYLVQEYNEKVIAARAIIKQRISDVNIVCHGDMGNYLLIDMGNNTFCKYIVDALNENLIYVKSNYQIPWDTCFLITLGPINIMEKFLSIFEKYIKMYKGKI